MKTTQKSSPADQTSDGLSATQAQTVPEMPLMQTIAVDVLIRLPAVLQIIPVSRSKFYKEIKRGAYPKPQKIGQRIAVWRLSTIENLAMAIAT